MFCTYRLVQVRGKVLVGFEQLGFLVTEAGILFSCGSLQRKTTCQFSKLDMTLLHQSAIRDFEKLS